jgi:hypothetical protein
MVSGSKVIGLSLLLIVGCSSSDGGPSGGGGAGGASAGGGSSGSGAGGLDIGNGPNIPTPAPCSAFCSAEKQGCDPQCIMTCATLYTLGENCKTAADAYYRCAAPIVGTADFCWMPGAIAGEMCQTEYYAVEACQ